MSKFYLQSGYNGKETTTIALSYSKDEFNYSAIVDYAIGDIPVGSVESVEFVEKYNEYMLLKDKEIALNQLLWIKDKYPDIFNQV